jgi:hypothetical protein
MAAKEIGARRPWGGWRDGVMGPAGIENEFQFHIPKDTCRGNRRQACQSPTIVTRVTGGALFPFRAGLYVNGHILCAINYS